MASADISSHSNNLYAAGYVVAHEMLHQVIGVASFYKYGNSVNAGHSETKVVGPNLNALSSNNPIPQGPSSSLRPFETILPQQKEFLDSVFEGG